MGHQSEDNFNQLASQWTAVSELCLSCNNREVSLWSWLHTMKLSSMKSVSKVSWAVAKSSLLEGSSAEVVFFSIEPAKRISWSSILYPIPCLVSQRKVLLILTLVSCSAEWPFVCFCVCNSHVLRQPHNKPIFASLSYSIVPAIVALKMQMESPRHDFGQLGSSFIEWHLRRSRRCSNFLWEL